MPKDWKDIDDDEILNFTGMPDNPETARFQRILQKRSTDAVLLLKDKLTGLMETVYRLNLSMREKTDEVLALYDKISKGQSRQQNILIILSIVVALSTAVYTWITWQSVTAMKEANEIQRQLLDIQRRQIEQPILPKRPGKAPK